MTPPPEPTMRELDELDGRPTLIGATDLHLFNEGKHLRLHHCLGAHVASHRGVVGTSFAVWAPNAEQVSVFGGWPGGADPVALQPRASSGIWEGFVAGAGDGHAYQYRIRT